MKKILLILLTVLFIITFSSTIYAKELPNTWPVGVNLWTMDEDEFYKTMGGYPSYSGYEKNARMGAISPDGKYMAYVKQGPKLVIREYGEDDQILEEIPYGVKPVWSDDSRTLYFTKLTEVNNNLRHYWYRYTNGLFAAYLEDDFSNVEQLSDLKVYPNSYDSHINKLLLTWVRPEEKEYQIVKMNLDDYKIYRTGIYARDAIAAPEGKGMAFAKIATPLFFIHPYDKLDVDSVYVGFDDVYFENTGERYVVPNDYSKGGDYFIVSRLFDYKKKSSADETKRYYGMYAIDRSTGEMQKFLANYFGNFEANFRKGTNELVFTSRLSW